MGIKKNAKFHADFKFVNAETNNPKKAVAKKLCEI
jgi:hypothetical protein